MNTQYGQNEWLSAMADGELQGVELDKALALCEREEERGAWHTYHLIGDVMRSPELGRSGDTSRLLQGVRLAMDLAAPPATSYVLESNVAPDAALAAPAANDSIFRWKMAAGFASLAAVAALAWGPLADLRTGEAQGAQLAMRSSVPLDGKAAGDTRVLQASASPQVMIRDARLDELLAAHKQFSGVNALQMPAGFLRNATFETAPQQ